MNILYTVKEIGKKVEVASRCIQQYTTEIIVSIKIIVNLIKRSKIISVRFVQLFYVIRTNYSLFETVLNISCDTNCGLYIFFFTLKRKLFVKELFKIETETRF